MAIVFAIGLPAFAMIAAGVLAQDIGIVPRLTGPADPMATGPAPPIPETETFETRPMRSYPEQPPLIPHAIEVRGSPRQARGRESEGLRKRRAKAGVQ